MKSSRQSGYTLVEVMSAVAILAVVVAMITQVIVNLQQDTTKTVRKLKMVQQIRSVVNRLVEEQLLAPVSSVKINPAKFKQCYMLDGNETDDEKACDIRATYYKEQLEDGTLTAADVRALPMYRLYIEIEYREGTQVKTFTLSRLILAQLNQ